MYGINGRKKQKFPMEKDTSRVEISLEILSGDERKITLEVFDG